MDADSCEPCAVGYAQGTTGQASVSSICYFLFFSRYWHELICSFLLLVNLSQKQCLPCIPGSYIDVTGQESCKNCDAGTHAEDAKAETCEDCIAGKISSTGSATCSDCGKGQFQDEVKKSSCKDCLVNTFAKLTGQTSCEACGIGEFAEEGSARSQRCGAGTYGNGCLKCPLETARNSSDPDVTQCRQCKLGETTTIEGAAVCDKW